MSVVIVLDCGATNIRAIAVSESGEVVASHYIKNNTQTSGEDNQFHVWDFDEILSKLVICCNKVAAEIDTSQIRAVTVTTFGVDGAPFDKEGKQIYPVISWKCPRTAASLKTVNAEIDRIKLYERNGVGDYSFNTLYKLHWLKENEPEVFSSMDKFVFISSMLTQKLTGVFTSDRTMAGTSMLTDLDTGDWNPEILKYLGLNAASFPQLVDAGSEIGELLPEIGKLLGLPANIPVISTGHDTQFALIGSGAKENQAFLSSGTWEILMARSVRPKLKAEDLQKKLTVELDAVQGIYNPAIQWLSSAVVEWVVKHFYADERGKKGLYDMMVAEATKAGSGAGGLRFNTDFSVGMDGTGKGRIHGLSIHTHRGQVFRAVLEDLSRQLKINFDYLNSCCPLDDLPIVVVGGGAKNRLWNQLRANALQRPLHVIEQAEATVMGAAMVAFYGVGEFESIGAAQSAMKSIYTVIEPEV